MDRIYFCVFFLGRTRTHRPTNKRGMLETPFESLDQTLFANEPIRLRHLYDAIEGLAEIELLLTYVPQPPRTSARIHIHLRPLFLLRHHSEHRQSLRYRIMRNCSLGSMDTEAFPLWDIAANQMPSQARLALVLPSARALCVVMLCKRDDWLDSLFPDRKVVRELQWLNRSHDRTTRNVKAMLSDSTLIYVWIRALRQTLLKLRREGLGATQDDDAYLSDPKWRHSTQQELVSFYRSQDHVHGRWILGLGPM